MNLITNLITIFCIAFHESYPYRKSLLTNGYLMIYLILFFIYTLYSIFDIDLYFYWDKYFNNLFRKPLFDNI